jgi:dihydrofolate reductase
MAKLVYGMMQSLDGYVSGPEDGPGLGGPDEALHRHFNDHMRSLSGCLYGRRIYEIMRYWDEDEPGQDEVGLEFGAAWRDCPKWVVSRTLKLVGPNSTLVEGDLEEFVKALKVGQDGEIGVAGPDLARSLTELGLIDEYRLYVLPVALGSGKPFFAAPAPALHLLANDRVGKDTVLLRYVLA